MPRIPHRTRRMLLKDMGRAGLAVMILGTAACAAESTEPEGDTSPGGEGGRDWHRVDLGFVSAYIFHRSGEAALVDTGVPESADAIAGALSEIGLSWSSVGDVIVTHRHDDHQGSLEAVLDATGGVPWHAGAGDIAAIGAGGGTEVGDGDRVFGLEVIETPGHTPGHISLLDPVAGILAAGDALNGSDGGVTGANPRFTEDMSQANRSVSKLAGFDYEVALFGHGEPLTEGASQAVGGLAEELG